MGIFSSKYTTYVASTIYNLAGENAPDLYKIGLQNAVTSGHDLASFVTTFRQKNPSTTQKNYYTWAKTNYPEGQMYIDNVYLFREDINPLLIVDHATDIVFRPEGTNKTIGKFNPFLFTAELFSGVSDAAFKAYWSMNYYWPGIPGRTGSGVITYDGGPVNTYYATDSYDLDALYVSDYTYIGGVMVVTYDELLITDPNYAEYLAGYNAIFEDDYYPIINLRVDNKSIRHADFSTEYPGITAAYKKSTGGSDIEVLLDQIEANADIGDMDYIYMLNGISVNDSDHSSKKYIYHYFLDLYTKTNFTFPSLAYWDLWIAAYPSTIAGTPKEVPFTKLNFNSYESLPNFTTIHTEYVWTTIIKETVTISGKIGDTTVEVLTDPFDYLNLNETGRVKITHQKTATEQDILHVIGFNYINHIYGNENIVIALTDALVDPEPSGLILPLTDKVLRKLSVKDSANLVGSNSLLVINSYIVVKQKWYQRGAFAIVLTILSVIVAFYTGGLSLAGGGILGSNLAIGTALGASGTAALVIGAAVNAVAGLVVANIVTKAAVEVFGDELGMIVAAIVGTIVMSADFSAGGFKGIDWGSMLRAENLLKMTNALSSSYSDFVQSEASELMAQLDITRENYEEQVTRIEELTEELGLGGNSFYATLYLTDPANSNIGSASAFTPETPSVFLQRTLLTGTDIAQIDHNMIRDFATLNLTLPDLV